MQKVIRRHGHIVISTFTDFYDALFSYDGVRSINLGEMRGKGTKETSYLCKHYDPRKHEIKVDARGRNGTQEFRIRVDPSKARSVYEYIQRYKSK